MKHLISLLLALFLASTSWSQDGEESSDSDVQAAEASEVSELDEDEDDSDLDEPGYGDEEEDDFIPSQEVSADQSLPFPVDI